MLIDVHVHTREHSCDARFSALELAEEAFLCGLDGIVFTDHDFCWSDDALDDLRRKLKNPIVLLSGCEIMFSSMHLIALGCPSGPQGDYKTPRAFSDYVNKLGGVTIIAHPFSTAGRLRTMDILSSGASGLEAFNGRRRSFELRNVYECRDLNMAELAGSDAHGGDKSGIGACATVFPNDLHDLNDAIGMIRAKKTRAWRKI